MISQARLRKHYSDQPPVHLIRGPWCGRVCSRPCSGKSRGTHVPLSQWFRRSLAAAISGGPVVLIGYPTGVEGILARIDEPTLKRIAQAVGNNTDDLVQELARRKLIRPLVTQGHLGVVGPDRLVYDAQTTSGGSGGPVFNASGKVIGVNFAILSGFSGSNFAVPISHATNMVAIFKSAKAVH
jgi:S1-C subfamily serine protease